MTHYIRRYSSVNGGDSKPTKLVADVGIDTSYSSIGLIGSSSSGYASTFYQNTLWKLENFSGTTPPANAIEGQVWFNETNSQIYVFTEIDGTDSTQIENWSPFIKGITTSLSAHTTQTGINDPHQTTKSQVGLSLVDNVPVFNKNLNFSDVLDVSSVQANLSVYSSGSTYTRSQADSLFLSATQKAADSDKLDGYDSLDLVNITNPVVHGSINTNSISSNSQILRINQDKASIAVSTVRGDIELLSGFKQDLRVITAGTSGNAISLTNANSDPVVNFNVYNTSPTAGAVATLAKNYSFTKDNLYVGGNQVYHKGRIPSSSDIGALSVNGKASNSSLLNGYPASLNATANTIAESDGAGDVWARYFKTTLVNETPQSTANVIFRNDATNDNYMRIGTKAAFNSWLNIPARQNLVKSWIAFNGSTMSVYNSSHCSVSKLATGRYRITMASDAIPSLQLVLPMVGCLSSGGLQTGSAMGTGRLDLWGALVWIRSTSVVDIDVLHTYNVSNGYYARESFQTEYADNYYVSFIWHF